MIASERGKRERDVAIEMGTETTSVKERELNVPTVCHSLVIL